MERNEANAAATSALATTGEAAVKAELLAELMTASWLAVEARLVELVRTKLAALVAARATRSLTTSVACRSPKSNTALANRTADCAGKVE